MSRLTSIPHDRENEPSDARREGAESAGNAESRTVTDAQRREKAKLRMDEAKQEHARFFRVACEEHPRGQAGIVDLTGIPHQHLSEMCSGFRTVPGHLWAVLGRHSPRCFAAGNAAFREAYGAHREPAESPLPLPRLVAIGSVEAADVQRAELEASEDKEYTAEELVRIEKEAEEAVASWQDVARKAREMRRRLLSGGAP